MRSCVHCRCMYPNEHMVGALCRACSAPTTEPVPPNADIDARIVELEAEVRLGNARLHEAKQNIERRDLLIAQQCEELMSDPQIKEWRGTCQQLSLANKALEADIDALTAERDRLAAENAELRLNSQMLPSLHREVSELDDKLSAANGMLDRLREVLAKWMAFDGFNAYDAIGEIRAILNPENET